MALPLDQFVQQLEDSGILAGETIKDFIPPKASPTDAVELAKELVRRKKLTKFQAEVVYRGKGKSLLLGNYILMEEIGAGGMGQVFKARHRRMDRFVAIKLLPPATTNDKAAIERFEREVRASAKISHPNVVAAHDADCANGVHFLVMELVEGKDLSALVKLKGPFSSQRAVNCVLQAARGLEFAHKKGIVHRDIKPANLLMDTEGTVKILDMGLARLSFDSDSAPQTDLTCTGTIMGTVDYMAPEQALDTKTADARADVYALGCSLFYLLTGKATYDGDTIMKKLLAHREQPTPSLVACRPDVSHALDAVFQKMVAKKLEDRYQSMSEVIADLEPLEAGEQSLVNFQQSTSANLNGSAGNLSENLGVTQTIGPSIVNNQVKVTEAQIGQPPWRNSKVLIGAALFGVLILAGIIVSLDTKDGKLIVDIDQQDAMVQVLDLEGKVEISQRGGGGKIVISVDPGKHRLKVVKDGFTTYGQEFEMVQNGKKEITARLEPLEAAPVMVGTKPTPVAGEEEPLAFLTPGFEEWMKQFAGMPAEKQLEAVSKKLVELNPGFGGQFTHTRIDAGVVLELAFNPENVTDISPLRALAGLHTLLCNGNNENIGQLSDLSPLNHQSLAVIEFAFTHVSDLSAINRLPLVHLKITGTKVADLSPLRGMKMYSLLLSSTAVTDLSPLKGMPLLALEFGNTLVFDLTPLNGMSLTRFNCASTKVRDLSSLKGMPLRYLACNDVDVVDLSPLKGMPLELLRIHKIKASDFTLLSDMPLKELSFDFRPERDTELIRSIKTLETINEKPVAEFWNEVEAKQ
jgi:serine/threonine protein kinase